MSIGYVPRKRDTGPKSIILLLLDLTRKIKLPKFLCQHIVQKISKMDRIQEKRYLELIKEKKELEGNRPSDIDGMRQWKHSMGKILQELELFN